MIVYDSYVKPVLAKYEPSIQALEKLNRDAVQVLQAVLPQGITRLFEILAKVNGRRYGIIFNEICYLVPDRVV